MAKGGTTDPCASVSLWSIGVFDKERNPTYSVAILDFLNEKLGLDDSR